MTPGIKSSRPSHVNGPFSTASTILAVFMSAGAAHAQSAFVRVNQAGYMSCGSKRAYLMASGSESGATFVLKNSVAELYSGRPPLAPTWAPGAEAIRMCTRWTSTASRLVGHIP